MPARSSAWIAFDYARGLMADAPDDLRNDPELQREFSPKPLPGLEGVCWRPLPPRPDSLIG
jgi:hypothetical protein